jgi:hypothetical protein
VLVELGTWKGDSYCAFCQAVQALGLPTRCYAVDTWAGDEHRARTARRCSTTSRPPRPALRLVLALLQETFDDAAPRLADGSVDLLHVDGSHGYEAVAHDVETGCRS